MDVSRTGERDNTDWDQVSEAAVLLNVLSFVCCTHERPKVQIPAEDIVPEAH